MSKTFTAVVHTPADQRLELYLEKVKPGEYKLVGADGFENLEGQNLAFEVDTFPNGAINQDFSSDSYSCFGRSEKFSTLDFSFDREVFFAKDLPTLRKGLEKVRGTFIDSAEY